MAVNLKMKKKCHIVAPDWLTAGMLFWTWTRFSWSINALLDYLQERLNLETTDLSFSSLPFRFAEIAKVILDVYAPPLLSSINAHAKLQCWPYSASDDVENPDKIRSLLKDLREARQAKSREGLKTLDHSELTVSSMALSDFLCHYD